MTGLITLRAAPSAPRAAARTSSRSASEDEDGRALDWTLRQVNGLRFERWRAERGEFDDDIAGTTPSKLPAEGGR